MPEYVRPPIPQLVFYDDSGAIIDYGHRWEGFGNMPPNNAYSVISNPERFAPLHAVADALIEHLRETYVVMVSSDLDLANELNPKYGGGIRRAVRITPANIDGAPLKVAFTGFPGVIVYAGLLHDFPFPPCGCDACDDSIDVLIEELEDLVLGVTAGRFKESASTNPELPIRYDLRNPDGSGHSSAAMATGSSKESEAIARLRTLPDGWQPWVLRIAGD